MNVLAPLGFAVSVCLGTSALGFNVKPDEFAVCLAQNLKAISNTNQGLVNDPTHVHHTLVMRNDQEEDTTQVIGKNLCDLSIHNPTDNTIPELGDDNLLNQSGEFSRYLDGELRKESNQPGDNKDGKTGIYNFDGSFVTTPEEKTDFQRLYNPGKKGGYEKSMRLVHFLVKKEFCSGKEKRLESWILSNRDKLDPAKIIAQSTVLNNGNFFLGALTAFQVIRNYAHSQDKKNYHFGVTPEQKKAFFEKVEGGEHSVDVFKGVLQTANDWGIKTKLFTPGCEKTKTNFVMNGLYSLMEDSKVSGAAQGTRKMLDYASNAKPIPAGSCNPKTYLIP